MGLDVNWNYTGIPAVHKGNTGVSLISGFSSDTRLNDKRNFYIAINQSGADAHANYGVFWGSGYSGFSLAQFVDPLAPRYHLMSFVNSYLTELNYNFGIGDFPRAKASYVADNIVYFTSGSGVHVPVTRSNNKAGLFSDYKVAIPRSYIDGLPAALRPGDVTFSLTSTGYGPIKDLGFDLSDAKVQNCSIDIQIPREKLEFLGSYSPVDRPIIYPVPVTMSVDFIVGDLGSGSLSNLINNDFEFDTSLQVRNSITNPVSGQTIALLIDLKRAKFVSSNYSTSIGTSKTVSCIFKTELNPDDLSKGLFISGIVPNLIVGGQTAGSNGGGLPPDVIITPPNGGTGGTPTPGPQPPAPPIIYITNELITEDGLDLILDETGDPIADEPTIYNPGSF